jgi:hypothetical protein
VADEETDRRFGDLAHDVLAPLVLGGTLRPQRPFGARLALRIGVDRKIVDEDLRSQIEIARVRRARLLAPVDTLPELAPAEWALVAAVNDLVQVTNHELAGALTRGRYARLLASVSELSASVAPAGDVGTALARHATLGRILEVCRTDTRVSWWTGSANFRGQPPPGRLLKWSSLRRVRVDPHKVTLVDMCLGVSVSAADFLDAFSIWLSRSPLTDVATMARAKPAFRWSAPTLALVATPPGRTLAWRALLRQPPDVVVATLTRAAAELSAEPPVAKALAEGFANEVASALKKTV